MITLENVRKIYKMGTTEVRALDGVSFTVNEGEMVAIMGPSGSGKSTLLNILGCLDIPTSGTYTLDGDNVENLNDDQQAAIRNRRIGFIFQKFNLLARTSALDNVKLPLEYAGKSDREAREQAIEVLEKVGLGDRLDHAPQELSGGQQQRVAIARALANNPSILLADEPTGNLDSKTGTEIIRLFQHLHRDLGQTIIYITHDPFLARHTGRMIRLRDGNIIADDTIDDPLEAGTPRPSDVSFGQGAH